MSRRRRTVLLVLLLLPFVVLAVLVHDEPPPPVDVEVGAALRHAFGGGAHAVLSFASAILEPPWSFLVGAAVALAVGLFRGRRAFLFVLACAVASPLVVEPVKAVTGRLRPEASVPPGEPRSPTSYPSGHVAWTAATLGAVAVATTRGRRRGARATAYAFAAAGTLLLAVSRVHLGRHYPTDTVGGALAGVAVVLLALPILGRDAGPPPQSGSPQSTHAAQ